MVEVLLRTVIPLFLLIGAGFLSRKVGILKAGDERVLNAYIYFFALPALLFVNMVETEFFGDTFTFILAGMTPIFVVLAIYLVLFLLFRFPKDTLYLLILSTIFGNVAFFGIPFIMFAFPIALAERLAVLSVVSIAIVSVTISITVLELREHEGGSRWDGLKHVGKRLSKNPLILSIFFGILLSLVGVEIPAPVSTFLHMLGGSTTAVAIFMLGVFLYGRKYTDKGKAFGLSLLRLILLPVIASLAISLFGLPGIEMPVLVLMHSMPVAVSMIVLSERYNFHKELIASLILISTIGAIVSLNVWLLLLGYY
ncbi:MAG: AEC family transporter [Promethearchaeota archaeon]